MPCCTHHKRRVYGLCGSFYVPSSQTARKKLYRMHLKQRLWPVWSHLCPSKLLTVVKAVPHTTLSSHACGLTLFVYSLHECCHGRGYQHHCHLWGTLLTAFLCGTKPGDFSNCSVEQRLGVPADTRVASQSRDVGEEEMTAVGDGGRATELLLSESG